jgi:hypothetical protein
MFRAEQGHHHQSCRPSRQQFNVFYSIDAPWKGFLVRDILTPFYISFFPTVLCAELNVAGPANILLFRNLTEFEVLGGPPYGFNPSSVGFSSFASALAVLWDRPTPTSRQAPVSLSASSRGGCTKLLIDQ